MEKKFLSILVLINVFVFSQVGIKTETPRADLHVNGALQVTKDFRTGGDGITEGYSGLPGDFLRSQGPGKPPVWKGTVALNIPSIVLLAETDNLQQVGANTLTHINFKPVGFNYVDGNAIKQIDSHTFKIMATGYYLVNFASRCLIGLNGQSPEGSLVTNLEIETASGTISNAIESGVAFNSHFSPTITNNLYSVVFLNGGTTFSLKTQFTKDVNFSDRSLSLMFLHNQ